MLVNLPVLQNLLYLKLDLIPDTEYPHDDKNKSSYKGVQCTSIGMNNFELCAININFRSIINKCPEFLQLIDSLKPHIIFGTETWLSNSVSNTEIIPDNMNYTIYRKDRDDGYGGVMIAVSKHILSTRLPDLETCCENLWIKLSIPACKDLYLCTYYRPHISDLISLEQLNNSLSKVMISTKNPMIWLSGDFNAPNINWQTLSIPPESPYLNTQQLLLDITQDYDLSQMVLNPTRLNNTLDLFLTNFPNLINNVQIVPGLSDHDVVVIQSKMRTPTLKQASRKIPLYNKANWEAIRNDLQSLEGVIRDLTSKDTNIDKLWEIFRDSILHTIDKHIPHKTSRKRCTLPWISIQLRRQIKKRNKLYHKAKQTGSADTYNKFLDLKHSIQSDLRKSYWQYINNLISPESIHDGYQNQKSSGPILDHLKETILK